MSSETLPCPACGEPLRDYYDGSVHELECTRCEFTITAAHYALVNPRAAALLRACEGWDTSTGDPYFSVMHQGASFVVDRARDGTWRITRQWTERGEEFVASVLEGLPSLAAALIALAARLEVSDA